MAALRILVAEPDEIIRELLTGIITSNPDSEVISAANCDEAIDKVLAQRAEIAFVDSNLPPSAALGAVRLLAEKHSTLKVVALGLDDSLAGARAAFDAGALGYVLKAHATRDLLPALRAIQEGRTFFSPRIAETILRSYVDGGQPKSTSEEPLSERKREALRFLAREAASDLGAPPSSPVLTPSFFKKGAIALVIAISAGFGWTYYRSSIEQKFPVVDNVLEHAGLKGQAAPSDDGNPDAKVWVDLHTGLYYCRGERSYGKTPRGKYERQQDAQFDQFQPANRKPCE
jgi:DNA-binding NarL/FixJ family response regulator